MKIPLIWLKDYLDIDKSPREIADSFTRIGLMLDKPVGEDQVLDLEQRLNRSDLLNLLGCARDLAVFENIPLREPKIKLHKAQSRSSTSHIKIKVETKAVNRFNTRVFLGVKVAPSPTWLKERLELYGLDSINNIVDITNFVMLEMGQPMHAQDIDKLPQKEIVIRQAKEGEQVTTLLGTTIKLDQHSFVLTSGGEPQVIGGIVGGQNSGVTQKTTNIILDAGNYNPRIIRTASRRLKIMNETVSRYDKPLDPRLCELALNRATDLILELAGGSYYENEDYYPDPVTPQSLTLTLERLQSISGENIPLQEARRILTKLGYVVTDESKRKLTVEVPYYRTDLEVEDDLISDVLRMRDYNNITSSPLSTPIPTDITPSIYKFEEKLRDYMVSLGAHEHITTQLVENDNNPDRVVLENALSEDQNALRMSALETLPAVSLSYTKHGKPNHILFEIGKSFIKTNYHELRELAVIDPQDVRATLAALLHLLGLKTYSLKSGQSGTAAIIYNKSTLGRLVADRCSLDIEQLQKYAMTYPSIISDFSHKTTLDVSLSYPSTIAFESVEAVCQSITPAPDSLQVVDEYKEWKLVRLTWSSQIDNLDRLRQTLFASLKAKGITTRSD